MWETISHRQHGRVTIATVPASRIPHRRYVRLNIQHRRYGCLNIPHRRHRRLNIPHCQHERLIIPHSQHSRLNIPHSRHGRLNISHGRHGRRASHKGNFIDRVQTSKFFHLSNFCRKLHTRTHMQYLTLSAHHAGHIRNTRHSLHTMQASYAIRDTVTCNYV